MASLGTRGLHSRNCHSELLRKITPPRISGESFSLPMDLKTAGVRMVEQSILLPHVLFATLFEHYPSDFEEGVTGPPGRLQQFWDVVETRGFVQGHQVLSRAGFKQNAVPLSFHGDGAPVAGVGKVQENRHSQYCKVVCDDVVHTRKTFCNRVGRVSRFAVSARTLLNW